ncbi:radical SAM protein [Candidatus Woesearchaeota archaeon]|nr:radical SAM protein [Candidatus Woesearchaeota archaeon]
MITLINPNIVTQKGDYFGSGIPYWPITLAYIAGLLKKHKIKYEVIDAFGKIPQQVFRNGTTIVQGLFTEEIVERVSKHSKYIIIYSGLVFSHERVLYIINSLNENYPKKKIIVVGNIHQVVSYDISKFKKDFKKAGADKVIVGEPENQIAKLLKKKKVDVLKLMPDWSKFPLRNYWNLGYAHAPYKRKYMPILTSRGCPGKCNFCINPKINKSKWRPRSAKKVLEEINNYIQKYKIEEIHFTDLNPVVDDSRIRKILYNCPIVNFKFATGTKLEFLHYSTLYYLTKGDYLSFSPESGSKRILKKMNKSFDFEHGIEMTKFAHLFKITTQACFVIGYPGETDQDRKLTRKYIHKLTRAGVDEIALFIFAPIPGAKSYSKKWNYKNISDLTFSPRWRKEYKKLNKWRQQSYVLFFLWKLLYHPFSYFRIKNTKIFNTIKRAFKLWRLSRC